MIQAFLNMRHLHEPRSWIARLMNYGFLVVGIVCTGCGRDSTVPTTIVTIVQQPQSLSVPIGGAAQFVVVATGDAGLSYQWFGPNGAISGAVGSELTLAAVTSRQDQTSYYVVVSDHAQQITSQKALLTVGPRSPKDGDLRFQQVDSPSTRSGYGDGISINLLPLQERTFSSAIGIPLSVGPGCQNSSVDDISDCAWIVDEFYQPPGVPALNTGYGSYRLSTFSQSGSALGQPNTVVTGFDERSAFDSIAMSWVTDPNGSGYTSHLASLPLAAAATQVAVDGANGKVVTAISLDSGQVTYISYGWTRDAGTKYDTSIEVCSKTTAAATAKSLADQGYILTATGGNDVDGIVLVGTKVAGDSEPRPFMAIENNGNARTLTDGGYAVVGVFYTPSQGFIAWLGEK